MPSPPIPDNETQRLAALEAYEILDTKQEKSFDELVNFATRVAKTPVALISLIDGQHQWCKASVGMSETLMARELALCSHVVGLGRPLIVEDLTLDPRFVDHPMVTQGMQLRAYAGFPLQTEDGLTLGTLCVADVEPHKLDSQQLSLLEGLATRAMRELELHRQLQAVGREKRALLERESGTKQVNELLKAMSQAQESFLLGRPAGEIFAAVLQHFLELTGSEFGFIGEVFYERPGVPHLVTHAITDIAWNEETRRIFADRTATGMEFRNLESLFGHVMTSAETVISNSPSGDPRRGGLPSGHPTLHRFLGIPMLKGGALLGMVGVANRPGGYEETLVDFLAPFVATCASLFEARRAEQARYEVKEQLEQTLEQLRQGRDELARFFDLLSVGTVVVDGAGAVIHVSKTGLALAGIDTEVVGRAWNEVLAIDDRARAALELCMTLAEQDRSRVGARLDGGGLEGSGVPYRPVEIDVRDDPRNPSQRILFLYDVSELFARTGAQDRRHAGIVGESEVMHELYDAVDQVAAGSWTVLIEGETGAGKELVARAIHQASSRRTQAFVAVNCAGLTDTLLSSQLFGHIKGAFTGAVSDRRGLFEAASGGTIFLDEIGDISLSMQRALLRVLQEREITRVGETHPRKVDVRVLAATHRDIQAMAATGEFRQDLVYRIRIVRLSVPPLRDRMEDIPALVSTFLANEQVTSGKDVRHISPAALRCLMAHNWPGNVRELRGAIEHGVVHSRGSSIELWDLPPELRTESSAVAPSVPRPAQPELKDERAEILAALREAGGNRSRAAKLLGIGRATLYRRLDTLDIDVARALGESSS